MIRLIAFLIFLAPAVFAQSPRAPDAGADSVVVSRRAVTFSFVPNRSDSMANGRQVMAGVNVALILSGRDPVAWFKLHIVEPVNAPAYRSALRPMTCSVMTDTYSCRDSTTVEITNERLVISIRDSAMVALMFADRPTAMSIHSVFRRQNPGGRAVVRFADPELLPPSKEALAEYDRALGRDGWSPWLRELRPASPVAALDPVWVQVGQRITASVSETQCRPIDSCNERADFSTEGWVSSDSSVAALAPSTDPRRVTATVHALRPGTATITVGGLHGPSDDLPRSARIATLARKFVVTNRLSRIQITPRPTTIVAGSEVKFEAQLIDEKGAVIVGAPINFLVLYDWLQDKQWANRRYDLATRANLTTPGHRRFIAYFGNLADTLDLEVVPRAPEAGAYGAARVSR